MIFPPANVLSALIGSLKKVKASVRGTAAKQIGSKSIRAEAKGLVNEYFRSARPHLTQLGVSEELLVELDRLTQELLSMAQRRALRSLYLSYLKALEKELNDLEGICITLPTVVQGAALEARETQIADTLSRLVRTAGLSYRQACKDLGDASRRSYRGTAAELREALREILDQLAPDNDVAGSPGFRLEAETNKPTMKQKVRYIMRCRGKSDTVSKVPEHAVEAAEEKVASLARSVYSRSSLGTHIGSTREEVVQIKAYIEVVLGELLEPQ